MTNRIAKPLYFYMRFKTARNTPKRAYYYSRLLDMGIDAHLDEVLPTEDNHHDKVIVRRHIRNTGMYKSRLFNHMTRESTFLGFSIDMPKGESTVS